MIHLLFQQIYVADRIVERYAQEIRFYVFRFEGIFM